MGVPSARRRMRGSRRGGWSAATALAISLLALALLAVTLSAVGGATTGSGGGQAALAAGEDRCPDGRADPATDVQGWEQGCWYNDSLAINNSAGLNETDLDRVAARSMARVEQIRGIEFERDVPISLISRETYRDELAGDGSNATTERSVTSWDVVTEALFLVGEETDAEREQQNTTTATILGFYSPSTDRIVIVSENASEPKLDELTLSQELFHGYQDRHFGLTGYDRETTDGELGLLGIIEGDANLVQHRYTERCENSWDCLEVNRSEGDDGGSDSGDSGGGSDDGSDGGDDTSDDDDDGSDDSEAGAHLGLQLYQIQPYNDGPPFVKGIQEAGGWAAVDDVYEDPPVSTEQVIHPDAYPDETPRNASVPDRSSAGWDRLEAQNETAWDTVGEAGLFSMFLYPFYDSDGAARRGLAQQFLAPSNTDSINDFDYRFEGSAGWDGDRLYPYVPNGSTASTETGYVWRLLWESPADAEEFQREYYEVLAYNGAEPVDGRVHTFEIDNGSFADAIAVERTDDEVLIVNAPNVTALSAVHAGAAPTGTSDYADTVFETAAEQDDTPTPTATPTETPDGSDSDGGDGPGFGLVAAVLSLTLVVVGSARYLGQPN